MNPVASRPYPKALPVPGRCSILGVGVHALDMPATLHLAQNALESGEKVYVCAATVHVILEAQEDRELREILNASFLTLPDGMPTVWLARASGFSGISRVYTPDFMIEFCRQTVKSDTKHFLYGGSNGTSLRLKQCLEEKIPGIQIVGVFEPPFTSLTPEEESRLLEAISRDKPDVVWVGLSSPKKERFMKHYLEKMPVRMMVAVGAAFDIHAGIVRDAPQWMKRSGLQWLFRLLQEPRRLWRRYLIGNIHFLLLLLLDLLRIRKSEPPA